jgi:hypothetical protein
MKEPGTGGIVEVRVDHALVHPPSVLSYEREGALAYAPAAWEPAAWVIVT